MKMIAKTQLRLHGETVRHLDAPALMLVGGGRFPLSNDPRCTPPDPPK